MKISLSISGFLHALLILLVFWKASDSSLFRDKAYAPLELVSLEDGTDAHVTSPLKKEKQKTKQDDLLSPTDDSTKEKFSENSQNEMQSGKLRGSLGSPDGKVVDSYIHQLQFYIEKNRFYPRKAMRLGQQGTVKLRLVIQKDGRFSEVEIIEPSPFQSINEAAYQLVSNLGTFKPLPEPYKDFGEFIIPIAYKLTR